MKKLRLILIVSVMAATLMSACKINTPTPPVLEPTQEPAEEQTQLTEEALPTTVVSEPTACPTPDPATETNLFDDSGKMVCTVEPGFLSSDTEDKKSTLAIIGDVTDADWSIGPKDAKLTIIEYSDFQCPYCKQTSEAIDALFKDYPDDVRVIFRSFPLNSIHPNASLASQAAEAAGLQGKFWEMHTKLFGNQETWSPMGTEDFTAWLTTTAKELELNVDQFTTDLTSEAVVQKVTEATNKATEIGLGGTPTLFINGYYMGNLDYYTMENFLKVYDFEATMYTECPNWVIDTEKNYQATIKTEKGEIVVDLFEDEAPLAVNSFVFLAEEGYYDDTTFHRVIKDSIAQAGDPTGTGYTSPGYAFRNETAGEHFYDRAGLLGMANSGADRNGSQFFITYAEMPQLNCSYTIFGEVVSGMDVLNSLTERDPQANPGAPAGDEIISVTIDEK